MNDYIPSLILDFLTQGHKCTWAHNSEELSGGDCCFYLSYGRIVDRTTLNKYRNNLVVHESDLPKGKGWSPLTWQILEGRNRIPVTLIEAVESVDAGHIYAQTWLELEGHELIDELRAAQAKATHKLCIEFVRELPTSAGKYQFQCGEESFYPRRTASDSELNLEDSLEAQFNLLRVVDNTRYPAFFFVGARKFILKIDEA